MNLSLPVRRFFVLIVLTTMLLCAGCSGPKVTRTIEATAYCDCSSCCGWQRGSADWLWLDFWNRYVSSGSQEGRPYSGLTASGTVPYEVEEGFFSLDTVQRPWMIPVRLILFPWYFLPHDGTIAADTKYYPFGTRMYVPGYGWGIVQDRGGAIKGPERIDLYFSSHGEALQWGRQKVKVTIESPK